MKEKIKDRLEKEMGPKLDSAADLAVEMLMGKMEMKQQDMKHKKEMMVRMKEMMTD